MRATIRDVSRLAGVSRMTVSRVLSSPDLVLPATRARVQDAIGQLGYVPDRTAGALATRRTGFVALLLPTLTNANFAGAAQGMAEALRGDGYELLIGTTSYGVAEEVRQVRALLARRPEALVLAGAARAPDSAAMLTRASIPVIEIADLPARPIGWAVGFSNRAVGRTAALHLLARGHRRVAALGAACSADLADTRGEDRLRGFAAALLEAGHPTDLVLRHGLPPVSFEQGAAALAVLLDREPHVDAVFAISDLAAVGVLMECRRRGIAVPGDIAVMGFGDFDIGRQVVPALTTVAVDFPALGRRAGELLGALLRGETPEPRAIDVGHALMRRVSG